jgi:hypothetical protein
MIAVVLSTFIWLPMINGPWAVEPALGRVVDGYTDAHESENDHE